MKTSTGLSMQRHRKRLNDNLNLIQPDKKALAKINTLRVMAGNSEI